MYKSSHIDTFANDHLPDRSLWPDFVFDLPQLQFPDRLNCAWHLLDQHVENGHGNRVCIRSANNLVWTYSDLQAKANQIANVLVSELGVVAGNRVLLRSANNPMLVACWFAVMKVGAIAVATMPLLRSKELNTIVDIGQISHALCDEALLEDLILVNNSNSNLKCICAFNSVANDSLESRMLGHSTVFSNVDTASEDVCLLGFTSGTTGTPKATMHFHRDVMAICKCWPIHILKAQPDDIFIGSPPLAFTFGLGGLVIFPMSIGASTVLLEKASPALLLDGIKEFGATVVFTAPTSYRAMASLSPDLRSTTLRKCISAGEALSIATRALWKESTGIELIDGIGTTEMLHIFISHTEEETLAGSTGKPVPGYRAKIVDDQGVEVPPGVIGNLAVLGPTGCRYLADDRQKNYVKNGWNVTGDAYLMTPEGYFVYQARTDDMIISSGYNIAAPEVEQALLLHEAVQDCAVIGVADAERGQLVKAFVVLKSGSSANESMIKSLQDFVKQTVAPYKYPRIVEFVNQLPRTETGKLQRFKLQNFS
jgi:2-aminobenzoate-CoA ligase